MTPPDASARYSRKAKEWRLRRHQNGGRSTLVDAEPYRAILNDLAVTMSWTAIGRLCGYNSHRHVRMIAAGDYSRIGPATAARIRAAAGKVLTEGGQRVVATGSRRRLQALIAIGYSVPRLVEEIGYSGTPMKKLINGDVDAIRADTHGAICDAYRRLHMRPPRATDHHERGSITRSKNRARLNGWAPPLAWNDIDTDARPRGVRDAADAA